MPPKNNIRKHWSGGRLCDAQNAARRRKVRLGIKAVEEALMCREAVYALVCDKMYDMVVDRLEIAK